MRQPMLNIDIHAADAACTLLIRESGRIISDLDKSDNFMCSGNIVVSNLILRRKLTTAIAT